MPATPTTVQELANTLGFDMSGLSVRIQNGATIYSGSGAPSAGVGQNGDWYLRTDTPGTLAQRIYIKSAGSWTNALA